MSLIPYVNVIQMYLEKYKKSRVCKKLIKNSMIDVSVAEFGRNIFYIDKNLNII
jgi:translation initiation factor 2 beta subunit (eIF-2beta)/eIF-5